MYTLHTGPQHPRVYINKSFKSTGTLSHWEALLKKIETRVIPYDGAEFTTILKPASNSITHIRDELGLIPRTPMPTFIHIPSQRGVLGSVEGGVCVCTYNSQKSEKKVMSVTLLVPMDEAWYSAVRNNL